MEAIIIGIITLSLLACLIVHGISYWRGYVKGYKDAKNYLPSEYKIKKIEMGDEEL